MKTNSYVYFGVVAAALSGASAGYAQSPPGSIPVGSMYAYPELEAAVRRDSNIAIQPSSTAVSDTIFYLRPAVRFEAKQGANQYNFGYRGEFGRYNKTTNFDFENHDLFADANMTHDARNNLKLRAMYQDRVDPPGTLNIATKNTPNEWRQPSIAGLYTYGAEDAEGKFELEAGYLDKRYVSNRFATSALDYSRSDYGGTFLWRAMPKTYLTIAARQSAYDYRETISTLDSRDTFILLGARWEATAATSGRFSIGKQKKQFDTSGSAAGRQDFTGTAWEGGLTWKPLTYSTVDIKTQRRTSDSTGLGDFILNETFQALWTHAWNSQVTSIVTGSYSNDKFSNSQVPAIGGAPREDKTKSLGVRVNYSMRRWLKIGAEYLYTGRDSNDINSDFRRNQLMLFVSATP